MKEIVFSWRNSCFLNDHYFFVCGLCCSWSWFSKNMGAFSFLRKAIELFLVLWFCLFVWVYSLFCSRFPNFREVFFGRRRNGEKFNLAPVGGGFVKRGFAFFFISFGRWLMSWKEKATIESHEKRMVSPTKNEKHNDSFVFFGYDDHQMLLARLGFRGNGKTEVWLTFFTEKYGKLKVEEEVGEWPSSDQSISSNNLIFSPIIIGKKWKIQYNGPMKCERDGSIKNVEIDFVFDSNSGMYHSDTHLDSLSLSTAMSSMPWSLQYFRNLKSQNQKRIENGGTISGTYIVNGNEEKWTALSIRDHSWGQRDWQFIHRYMWILVSFSHGTVTPCVTDNGVVRIQHMCFTTVNYGTFTSLVAGWVSGEKEGEVFPIVEATPIEDVGENGEIPTTFTVHFRAKGFPLLSLHCHRQEERVQSWVVAEGKFEVVETHSLFSLSSPLLEGGEKGEGVGMAEFGFSSRYPRPVFMVGK